MSKVLKVMCGIPGSGKSTWCRENISTAAKIISRDEIRFSLVSDTEEYFSHEGEVYAEFISQIKNALTAYDEVVADATHLNEMSRSKLLRALGTSLKDVEVQAVFLATSLDTALERNETREGRAFVPRGQIRRMFCQTTIPAFEEGFNKIIIVAEDGAIKEMEQTW